MTSDEYDDAIDRADLQRQEMKERPNPVDLVAWMRSIGFLQCMDYGEYSVSLTDDDQHSEHVHLVIDTVLWTAYIEEYDNGGNAKALIEIGKFSTQKEILALCKGLKAHITDPIPPCPGCGRNVKRLPEPTLDVGPYCVQCLWPLP